MSKLPFINRVKLRNYKSIAQCDVSLGPLTILVGPNGSGKSNFLDALALARGALDVTLDHALRERGGINEVRRRSGGHPSNFAIDLHFSLAGGQRQGRYSFEVTSQSNGGFLVRNETCEISPADAIGDPARFVVKEGRITETNVGVTLPRPASDRLFLVSASNVTEFRPVYDALTNMAFYSLAPDVMRWPQPPDSGELLDHDGQNLASVLAALERRDSPRFDRIQRYLSKVTPGIESVARIAIGNLETLQFRQKVAGQKSAWRFPAINMSDGTLRALAVLTALLQGDGDVPSLIGIEEPEIALHPAAAGILWDAMDDAQERAQVLVTTHSSDLLDRSDIPTQSILATTIEAGNTMIGPIVESSRKLLQEHLCTPGELLRQRRLSPTPLVVPPPPGYPVSLLDL
jgi:predicted ATPase